MNRVEPNNGGEGFNVIDAMWHAIGQHMAVWVALWCPKWHLHKLGNSLNILICP